MRRDIIALLDIGSTLIDGPPFAIVEDEVKQHYAAVYQLHAVDRKQLAGGLKGKVPASETAWLLQPAN